MKKYLFDVECLVRDGESFFSLYFKDISVHSVDLFSAYVKCHSFVHSFLSSAANDYFFILKKMECDNFD